MEVDSAVVLCFRPLRMNKSQTSGLSFVSFQQYVVAGISRFQSLNLRTDGANYALDARSKARTLYSYGWTPETSSRG